MQLYTLVGGVTGGIICIAAVVNIAQSLRPQADLKSVQEEFQKWRADCAAQGGVVIYHGDAYVCMSGSKRRQKP